MLSAAAESSFNKKRIRDHSTKESPYQMVEIHQDKNTSFEQYPLSNSPLKKQSLFSTRTEEWAGENSIYTFL